VPLPDHRDYGPPSIRLFLEETPRGLGRRVEIGPETRFDEPLLECTVRRRLRVISRVHRGS